MDSLAAVIRALHILAGTPPPVVAPMPMLTAKGSRTMIGTLLIAVWITHCKLLHFGPSAGPTV